MSAENDSLRSLIYQNLRADLDSLASQDGMTINWGVIADIRIELKSLDGDAPVIVTLKRPINYRMPP